MDVPRAMPVEDAALIEAETGVAVNRHGERPVFDEGLLELRDGRQLVQFFFVDVAPGQCAVVGCQYSVAVGGQVDTIGAFARDRHFATAFYLTVTQGVFAW